MGNIIVWLVILGAFGWMAFNYFRIRKAANLWTMQPLKS